MKSKNLWIPDYHEGNSSTLYSGRIILIVSTGPGNQNPKFFLKIEKSSMRNIPVHLDKLPPNSSFNPCWNLWLKSRSEHKHSWMEKKQFLKKTLLSKKSFYPYHHNSLKKIETWRKMHKYRNYLLLDVQHMWLVNTKTNTTTHMIEVRRGKEHNDKQPDGTPKWIYQYPTLAYHQLNQPIPHCVDTPMKSFKTIVYHNPYENLGNQGQLPLNRG